MVFVEDRFLSFIDFGVNAGVLACIPNLDKVRLNCYYYRHYSFIKDIQMILCTVLGKKMKYAGEEI